MNTSALLSAVLLAALLALTSAGDDKLKEKIQKSLEKCKEKHNPPESDIEFMKKKDMEHEYAKESKCMIACMLEEAKILRDGQYNKENALLMSDVIHKDNAEDAAKAREVVETCVKNHPEVGDDQCEFAYQMALCGCQEAKKLGMEEIPDFFSP